MCLQHNIFISLLVGPSVVCRFGYEYSCPCFLVNMCMYAFLSGVDLGMGPLVGYGLRFCSSVRLMQFANVVVQMEASTCTV